MKSHCLTVIFISFFVVSCVKKYKFTTKVCDKKLYVETFNVNPAGVDADYLTDSLNFRLYIGKLDNEHENFHYICEGDSIIVEKIASLDATGIMRVIETRIYYLIDLKKMVNYNK